MASITNVTIPDLGGADDVTIIEVLVKGGDVIKADTPLVTLESDKATMEVPGGVAGTVKELKVKVGDKVSTGTTVLTLEAGDASGKSEIKSESDSSASRTKRSKDDKTNTPSELTRSAKNAGPVMTEASSEIHAGPGVRRLAHELGIDLMTLQGSGPKHRILKQDLLARLQNFNEAGAAPMAPSVDFSKFGPVESQALSRIKKISGKHLKQNWSSIPHVTQFGDADITELEAFRQSQKAAMEKQNTKLTPLVFIMKAVVAALKAFPEFNSSLDSSGETLILKKYFHIGVAVDTPDGLVVPVVRDADKKGLVDLAKELAEMSEKARRKQLTPHDMQGGCFSISSLGGIGGTAFTPIINAPEVAILGVSKSAYQPVYQNGEFIARLILPLSLSYDHRVIDGAAGARFMNYLTAMLSDIRNLLM